ncbi:methyltransf_25 domain-containing protein [Caerostris darwini]|uniref:Methyltransf_25 domain-containing protein n=1 Tax=Caerostris darwini TaxID=1538125 RepID=A0AAV4U775_9ARAC|nr:methyltransf_25 domain-containing protein [Caerostris darwini]
MNLDLDSDLYIKSHVPSESVIRFLEKTLPQLGWIRSDEDVVMDVGCGPGGVTTDLILPVFPRLKKLIAIDLLSSMINIARKHNPHPLVQYEVADIEDWTTMDHWEGQMTKVVSIHCFHWLRNQRNAFKNVFKLLKTGGEAAFIFFSEASFFSAVLKVQENSKWCHFFNISVSGDIQVMSWIFPGKSSLVIGSHHQKQFKCNFRRNVYCTPAKELEIDTGVPDSHCKQHNAFYYKEMLAKIGFEILHLKEKNITDVLPSDEDYINFFTSVCVLVPHVPMDRRDEFQEDLFQEILQLNGRDSNGLPFHAGKIIELVVKKN